MTTVLLSSAGRRVALMEAIRHDLRSLDPSGRVVATDMSLLTSAGHAADALEPVPAIGDTRFVPALLEICQRHAVDLLIPTIDTELAVLASSRDRFADSGTDILISGPQTVAISLDKVATHEWLVANDLPTVGQRAAGTAVPDTEEWALPLLVKPRGGSASQGVRRVHERGDLDDLGDDILVQTIAEGDEYTVDVWVDPDGTARCAVPRRRIEVRAGEVSKGITVRVPQVEDLARRIGDLLPDAYGPITIQIFFDGTASKVIEINARFGGGFPLAWQAGARLPLVALKHHLDLPVDEDDFSWRDGLVMLRYDAAVFVDRGDAGL